MRQQFCYWMLVLSVFLWFHSHFFYSIYVVRTVGFASASSCISGFVAGYSPPTFPFTWDFSNSNASELPAEDWLLYSTRIGFGYSFTKYEKGFCIPCWLLVLFWLYRARMALAPKEASRAWNWGVAFLFVATCSFLSYIGFMTPLIALAIITTLTTFLICVLLRIRSSLKADAPCSTNATTLRLSFLALSIFLWPYSYFHPSVLNFSKSDFHSQVGRMNGSTGISLYWDLLDPNDKLIIQEDYQYAGFVDNVFNIFPMFLGFGTQLDNYSFKLCFPYWLISVFWFPWKTLRHARPRFQFRVIHLLALMTLVAIMTACITQKASILLDVILILATLSLIAMWIRRELWRVARNFWNPFRNEMISGELTQSAQVGIANW